MEGNCVIKGQAPTRIVRLTDPSFYAFFGGDIFDRIICSHTHVISLIPTDWYLEEIRTTCPSFLEHCFQSNFHPTTSAAVTASSRGTLFVLRHSVRLTVTYVLHAKSIWLQEFSTHAYIIEPCKRNSADPSDRTV